MIFGGGSGIAAKLVMVIVVILIVFVILYFVVAYFSGWWPWAPASDNTNTTQ